MLSFFTILLILVGANALFMVFSLAGPFNGNKSSGKAKTKAPPPKVYPLRTLTSRFKKAV
jgi:hypothetical protein